MVAEGALLRAGVVEGALLRVGVAPITSAEASAPKKGVDLVGLGSDSMSGIESWCMRRLGGRGDGRIIEVAAIVRRTGLGAVTGRLSSAGGIAK